MVRVDYDSEGERMMSLTALGEELGGMVSGWLGPRSYSRGGGWAHGVLVVDGGEPQLMQG